MAKFSVGAARGLKNRLASNAGGGGTKTASFSVGSSKGLKNRLASNAAANRNSPATMKSFNAPAIPGSKLKPPAGGMTAEQKRIERLKKRGKREMEKKKTQYASGGVQPHLPAGSPGGHGGEFGRKK